MIIKRNGKFYKIEEKETELSEMEAMQERIAELEEKVRELEARPIITVSPVTFPVCPCPKIEPIQPTYPGTGTGDGVPWWEINKFTC